LPNKKERSVCSRKRSFDEQQVVGGVDLDQRMIAGRHLVNAHVTGHANALLGLAALAAPRGARRDRSGRAMLTLRAVRRGLATEAVTLHDAREALALGDADAVDELHFAEQLDIHRIARLLVGGVFELDLTEEPLRANTR